MDATPSAMTEESGQSLTEDEVFDVVLNERLGEVPEPWTDMEIDSIE